MLSRGVIKALRSLQKLGYALEFVSALFSGTVFGSKLVGHQKEEFMEITAMPAIQREALERLIQIALGNTGQSARVANFLLAWWNAEECGGFDLTDLWRVDASIAADMVTVFGMVAERNNYPDTLGYGAGFEKLVSSWRALHKASAGR
jgi:hypothetical protein